MKKKALLSVISFFLVGVSMIYGCGGGGGGTSSIGDKEPGDIYLKPSETTAADKIYTATDSFNKGNYLNSQAEFQKAYEVASAQADKNRALSGIAWSLLKSGSEAGSTDTSSVIFMLEKIPAADLYDYKNQAVNDARVALAMAYVSKAKSSQDFANAVLLLEKIDPVQSTTNTYQPNKFFSYQPSMNHGVSCGQVHAMIAYLYFLQGNNTSALDHINYATSISPQDSKVVQIKSTLTVLGLFR